MEHAPDRSLDARWRARCDRSQRVGSVAVALLGCLGVALLVLPRQAAAVMPPHQTSSASPTEPLASLDEGGGFFAPSTVFMQVAQLVVDSRGRLITSTSPATSGASPVLPRQRVRTLNAAGIAKLRSLFGAVKLDRTYDWGSPPTADVPSLVTEFRRTDGNLVTNVIESFSAGEESLSAAQRSRRSGVRKLMTLLGDPAKTFGANVTAESLFVPERLFLRAAEPPVTKPDSTAVVADWPLPRRPIAGLGDCVVVDGADVAALLPVLRSANEYTRFRDGRRIWRVLVRVALPGDNGCRG